MKHLDNNYGFTIPELMLTILIISIIIAIATPLTNQTLDNFQYSNSIRMLLNTMSRSKGEAMNTGQFSSIVFTTNANGRVSYISFVDNGAGGGIIRNGIRDGNERIISSDDLPRGVSLNSANTTFQNSIINGVQCPYTQFSSLGFPIGTNPSNGTSIINYSGRIVFNATIGKKIISQSIQVGLGGTLNIQRTEQTI